MVTIKNTEFTSNLSLAAILNVMTKAQMLDICKKLELYVSPNLKKDETARRVAREILDNPDDVLHVLNKQELQIVDEFVKAGPNQYVIRKARKTFYKLQKFGLVLTFKDLDRDEWHMLMPDCVRESLSPYYENYLKLAEAGTKLPSKRQLRLMAVMDSLRKGDI